MAGTNDKALLKKKSKGIKSKSKNEKQGAGGGDKGFQLKYIWFVWVFVFLILFIFINSLISSPLTMLGWLVGIRPEQVMFGIILFTLVITCMIWSFVGRKK